MKFFICGVREHKIVKQLYPNLKKGKKQNKNLSVGSRYCIYDSKQRVTFFRPYFPHLTILNSFFFFFNLFLS